MHQDYDVNDDNPSYIRDWMDESVVKYAAPTAPSGSVYFDENGDCWETSDNNNAFNEGPAVTNQTSQYLQVPQTPALSSHGNLSPYRDALHEFLFDSSSIQQYPSSDAELGIPASPYPSTTETLPVPFPEKPASTFDSIYDDGILFPLGAAAVQVASNIDASLGRTNQILSPVSGNSSPATQVTDTGHPRQDQATFPSPAAQTIVWSSPGFIVQTPHVNQHSESVGASAPSSEIQVNVGSIHESLQISDMDSLNPQKSSKKIYRGRTQRKKRPPQHKPKLHEVNVPYKDQKKEKKRLDAIKSRRNREKIAKEKKEMSDVVAKLRKELEESKATIELMGRQSQQDRDRSVEYHRSELRRLEEAGQA